MDFLVVFSLSLCAELIANDKPLLVRYEGQWYFPLVKITASAISAARWRQRRIIRTPLQRQLENRGWVLWAPYALAPIPLILPPRSLSSRLRRKLAGHRCEWRRRFRPHPVRHPHFYFIRPDVNDLLQRHGRTGGRATGLLWRQSRFMGTTSHRSLVGDADPVSDYFTFQRSAA